jgi:hypothetical protein
MTSFAHVQPIGDHPGQPPEPVGQCSDCIAEAAARAVLDSFYNLICSRDFPAEAIEEFDSRYGDVIDEMIVFAADRAREYAETQDHSACEKHAPGPCE